MVVKPHTRGTEAAAAKKRAQTHCKHGHEYTPENTYRNPKDGTRDCRICKGDRGYKYRRTALLELKTNRQDKRHGTRTGYYVGCRCNRCGWANYLDRAERKERKMDHGTKNSH